MDLQDDINGLFYYLYMENEEKRYKEQQNKRELDNIVVDEKKDSGREDRGISRF